MPVADDRAPLATADLQILTVADAAIASRQRRDAGAEIAEALTITIQALFSKSCTPVESDRIVRHVRGAIGRHRFTHVEVTAAHPELTTPLLREPAGKSGVICVQVGRYHPGDGITLEALVENRAPVLLHLLVEYSGVDNRPTITVTQ